MNKDFQSAARTERLAQTIRHVKSELNGRAAKRSLGAISTAGVASPRGGKRSRLSDPKAAQASRKKRGLREFSPPPFTRRFSPLPSPLSPDASPESRRMHALRRQVEKDCEELRMRESRVYQPAGLRRPSFQSLRASEREMELGHSTKEDFSGFATSSPKRKKRNEPKVST